MPTGIYERWPYMKTYSRMTELRPVLEAMRGKMPASQLARLLKIQKHQVYRVWDAMGDPDNEVIDTPRYGRVTVKEFFRLHEEDRCQTGS